MLDSESGPRLRRSTGACRNATTSQLVATVWAQQIRGKFGHVYVDGGAVLVCFTDDPDGSDGPRKRPITTRQKASALKRLLPWVRRVQIDCEVEFIVEVGPGRRGGGAARRACAPAPQHVRRESAVWLGPQPIEQEV